MSPAEASAALKVGYILTSVAGESVCELDFDTTLNRIRKGGRPICLGFVRSLDEFGQMLLHQMNSHDAGTDRLHQMGSRGQRFCVVNRTSRRKLVRHIAVTAATVAVYGQDGLTLKHRWVLNEITVRLLNARTISITRLRNNAGAYICETDEAPLLYTILRQSKHGRKGMIKTFAGIPMFERHPPYGPIYRFVIRRLFSEEYREGRARKKFDRDITHAIVRQKMAQQAAKKQLKVSHISSAGELPIGGADSSPISPLSPTSPNERNDHTNKILRMASKSITIFVTTLMQHKLLTLTIDDIPEPNPSDQALAPATQRASPSNVTATSAHSASEDATSSASQLDHKPGAAAPDTQTATPASDYEEELKESVCAILREQVRKCPLDATTANIAEIKGECLEKAQWILRFLVRFAVEDLVFRPLHELIVGFLVADISSERNKMDMQAVTGMRRLRMKPQSYWNLCWVSPSKWAKAVSALNQVDMRALPCLKLAALVHGFKTIYKVHQEEAKSQRTMGADDLLPIVCYIVCQCDLRSPYLQLLLMQSLSDSEGELSGEGAYYLATFESALVFVTSETRPSALPTRRL